MLAQSLHFFVVNLCPSLQVLEWHIIVNVAAFFIGLTTENNDPGWRTNVIARANFILSEVLANNTALKKHIVRSYVFDHIRD